MRTGLVLTLIGSDRPGLVELLSRTVREHQGNWEASRMARMAGRFAGILQVSVATDRADDLVAALTSLERAGLRVLIERAEEPPSAAAPSHLFRLDLVGNDRAGVVREVSALLAELGVNVEDLRSECASAPMAGSTLLRVSAVVRAPISLSADALRSAVEGKAGDYMVDIAQMSE